MPSTQQQQQQSGSTGAPPSALPPCARFAGAVALVTGGTAGIGLAVAERLVHEGASVFICSRKQKNVDAALESLRAVAAASSSSPSSSSSASRVDGVAAHVGDEAGQQRVVDACVARFGKLDMLVSNVAVNPAFGPLLDTTMEQWNKIFDVNVRAAFALIKRCAPALAASRYPGGASVLIVASIAGLNAMPGLGAYSVSKTALLGLTKVCATELASSGIRVNALAPGIVKTNFSTALWSGAADDQSSISGRLASQVPLQRFAVSSEMGGPAAFLLSSDASYVTGEVLVAAGGMPSRL